METIPLTDRNFEEAVSLAGEALGRGGIVLYPTDTLYGLAVDALDADAVARLRVLKGREEKKPISIVVPYVDDIARCAELAPFAERLAQEFLPGPLTLVLPGKPSIPEGIMLNGEIGIRVPDDDFARALAERLGGPITATSANRAGFPTPPTPEAILEQFGALAARIDVVIDAGPRAGGVPSTVVEVKGDEARILREGALTKEDLGL